MSSEEMLNRFYAVFGGMYTEIGDIVDFCRDFNLKDREMTKEEEVMLSCLVRPNSQSVGSIVKQVRENQEDITDDQLGSLTCRICSLAKLKLMEDLLGLL